MGGNEFRILAADINFLNIIKKLHLLLEFSGETGEKRRSNGGETEEKRRRNGGETEE